jgi:murein DD-endopeptidase MepM/ murein hydrolase activator NlpD
MTRGEREGDEGQRWAAAASPSAAAQPNCHPLAFHRTSFLPCDIVDGNTTARTCNLLSIAAHMEDACRKAPAVIAAIKHFDRPAPVVSVSLQAPATMLVDLSARNEALSRVDPSDCAALQRVLQEQLAAAGATYGVGGYGEKRSIYSRAEQYECAGGARCVHLGVDIWLPSGEDIFSPFKATVHSLQNNDAVGDYGPTIILQHELQGVTFFTLYGHVSAASLDGKHVGQEIEIGEKIASVGAPPSNGDWPPHVHFQVMADMLGKTGDFPGVASERERGVYMQICPDPNLILRCPLLL